MVQQLRTVQGVRDERPLAAVVCQIVNGLVPSIPLMHLNIGEELVLNDDDNHSIVLVCGPFVHFRPVSSGNYQLFCYGCSTLIDNVVNEKVYFKWDAQFEFVLLQNNNSAWNPNEIYLYVYVNNKLLTGNFGEMFLQGVQKIIRCQVHNSLLARESASAGITCGQPGCNNRQSWRCSHSIGLQNRCSIGLCRRHADAHLDNGRPVVIALRGQIVPEIQPPVEEPEQVVELGNGPVENEDIADLFNGPELEVVDFLPEATTVGEPVTYVVPDHGSSGHFLVALDLRCRNKVVKQFDNTPVHHQQMLQRLASRNPDHRHPLIQPEAVLFPSIFYASVNNSAVGALPSATFGTFGNNDNVGGLASFGSHMAVRFRDHFSPTAVDVQYQAFAFDAELNRHPDSTFPKRVIKKGLENIHKSAVSSAPYTIADGFAVNRKGLDLANSIRDLGHWDYFVTGTPNMNYTPSLCLIRASVFKKYGQDTDEANATLQELASIMCRAWERVVKYFFRYLLHSPESVLGEIKTYWYRMEFQSKGTSIGNLPHFHGGLTLQPGTSTMSDKADKITCVLTRLLGHCGGTPEEIIENGFAEDYDDFVRVRTLLDTVTHHSCANGKFRCQKKTKNGDTVCRVPKHAE